MKRLGKIEVKRNYLFTLLMVVVTLVIGGCTGDNNDGNDNPVAPITYDITISGLPESPESVVTVAGITVSQQFQIAVRTSDGLLAGDVPVVLNLLNGSGSLDPPNARTNATGQLLATYHVNPEVGQFYARIEARVGGSSTSERVRVVGLPRPSRLDLTSSAPTVTATGDEQIQIPFTISLTDAQGNATGGLEVELELQPFENGGVTFGVLSEPPLTNIDGISLVNFSSFGQFGRQKVICRVKSGGGELAGIADTLVIKVNSLADVIGTFLMSITPEFMSVSIAEPASAEIEIDIRDVANRALVGIRMNVTADRGRISGNAVSDSSGRVYLDYIIRHAELPDSMISVALVANVSGTEWTSRTNIILSVEDPGEPSFVLVGHPSTIWADNGQTTITLTAILKDPDGEGITGASVSFGSAIGIAESPVNTDNRGVAISLFSDDGRPSRGEGGEADSLLITARVRSLNLESSIKIMIHPYDPVSSLIILPQVGQVTAGDLDSTALSITCYGTGGQPVQEPVLVNLGAVNGRIIPNMVGTVNGEATSFYYPPMAAGIDTLTGWVDNGNGDIVSGSGFILVLPGSPDFGTMSVDPDSLPINEPDLVSQIEVQFLDRFDNSVVEGLQVNFTTTLGSITQSANTDQNGIARAQLRSGIEAGAAQIIAEIQGVDGPVRVTGNVIFTNTPHSIEIEADILRIHSAGAGDTTSTNIYATVFDANRNIIDAPILVTIEFIDEPDPPDGCTFDGGGQIIRRETDEGVVAALVESGTELGAKRIRAYTWRDLARNDTISVMLEGLEVVPGTPHSLSLDYNPVRVGDVGALWIIEVWADVRDRLGNPVADGTFVFFSLDGGIGDIRSGNTVDGRVTVALSYTSPDTFEPVTVTGTLQNGDEEISADISFDLPLQEGAIEANAGPRNWLFEEDREIAEIVIWVTLTDGNRQDINNGLIQFSTDFGALYWLDHENDELVRFIRGRAEMLTGIRDENHDEEPGQATIYLIAEEDDIFDDPFVAEMIVTVEIILDGYEEEINDEVEITFTRRIE